jgi:hypothetical protein
VLPGCHWQLGYVRIYIFFGRGGGGGLVWIVNVVGWLGNVLLLRWI